MAHRIDDPSISDDDLLWRRIVNNPIWWKRDEQGNPVLNTQGSPCLSSAAFLDGYTGEVSVHLARLTSQEKVLLRKPDNGLVEITAAIPRSVNHIVTLDPTEEDESHSLICPPESLSKSVRKASAKKMSEAARWLVLPESLRS
ncbi:MAG TPA: hypothetical protein VNQ79_24440 [Blastocatellia bacterium]|nr:hypothetical protein [Blastocatellia bacterium]